MFRPDWPRRRSSSISTGYQFRIAYEAALDGGPGTFPRLISEWIASPEFEIELVSIGWYPGEDSGKVANSMTSAVPPWAAVRLISIVYFH
jgi:hypothetical protein